MLDKHEIVERDDEELTKEVVTTVAVPVSKIASVSRPCSTNSWRALLLLLLDVGYAGATQPGGAVSV